MFTGSICGRQVLLSWASLWECWRRPPRTRYGTRFTKDYSNEIEAHRSPRCGFCLLSWGQFSFRLVCSGSPGQATHRYTGWCPLLAPVCSGWGESTLLVHPAASANNACVSTLLVFTGIFTFLVDTYPSSAASALAANTFTRCAFAGNHIPF